MTVALGFCRPDNVEGLFLESIIRQLFFDDQNGRKILEGTVIVQASGPRIHAGRNALVRAFLKHERQPEWLLMVDADMVWAPDALYQLLAVADPAERPVVGGLCFGGGRSGIVFPTLYKIERDPGDGSEKGSNIGIMHNYPANALVRVDATGAAFLLIHRTVLERLAENYPEPHPWFAETVDATRGVDYGEDMTFCMRLAAIGVPVFVHTGVEIGHVKPQVIDSIDHKRYLAMKAEVGDAGVNASHLLKIRAAGVAEPIAEERPVVNCSVLPEITSPTYVVIPVKDRHELTQDLLDDLADDTYEQIWIFDNGSKVPARRALKLPERCRVIDKPKLSLTRMWNMGLQRAEADARGKGHESWQVAILNNDLRVQPKTLDLLARGLRCDDRLGIVYPDAFGRGLPADEIVATAGIAPAGMTGFCFMVRGELGLRVDPQFEWWCGDNDIEIQCRQQGYLVGCMGGVKIEHLEPNGSTAGSETLRAKARADLERFQEKYR